MSLSVLRLPADQFYWSILDASALPSPGRSAEQLGYLFEQVLPLPIDHLHAAYLRIDRTRYLACGMDRESLATLIRESGKNESDLLDLGPESIPDLDGTVGDIKAGSINLLTGAFEPRPVRRLRNRWLTQVAVLIAITALLTIFGLVRRTRQLDQDIAQVRQAQNAAYQLVLGTAAMSSAGTGGQPAELLLTSQLRRLRQTRQSGTGEAGASSVPRLVDCTQPFSSLLSIWPTTDKPQSALFMQTESIVITPSALTVRGVVPNTADAERLVNALTSPGLPGWQGQQPQLNASGQAGSGAGGGTGGGAGGGGVQVSLQWRAASPASLSEAKR